MTVDLPSVVVSAGVGALAGYIAARAGKRQGDAERRRAVASLLLAELRNLDAQLRQLDQEPHPGYVVIEFLVHTLDAFTPDLVLFDPDAMATLLKLRGHIRDIGLYLSTVDDVDSDDRENTARRDWRVRSKARLALEQMQDACDALQRNGAEQESGPEPTRWLKRPELPDLPPSPFRVRDQPTGAEKPDASRSTQ